MARVTVQKLSREKAKELLSKIEQEISMKGPEEVRKRVAKILNSSVPTYTWVGIYLLKGEKLVLDAWSGPSATEHVEIPVGKGICGFAAKAGRTEIVSDVSKDPRYIQCFPSTKSEIVVPIIGSKGVLGEIDIDSDQLDAFSLVDKEFLEAVAKKIAPYCIS
jgi:L-methionine (R)-S-oxide reductase